MINFIRLRYVFLVSLNITIFFSFSFLGPTYLDENVSPRATPIYLGIWFCCTMLGPPIGMIAGGMFLKIYTDIDAVGSTNFVPFRLKTCFIQ